MDGKYHYTAEFMNFEDKLDAGLTRDFLGIMYSIGAPKAVIEKEIDAEPTPIEAVRRLNILCLLFSVDGVGIEG